jgi:hypothetical protein
MVVSVKPYQQHRNRSGNRMTKVRVTRDVPAGDAHNYLGRDAAEGEVFYLFTGPVYACVDDFNGIALSEGGPASHPFFEFPRDAVEVIE